MSEKTKQAGWTDAQYADYINDLRIRANEGDAEAGRRYDEYMSANPPQAEQPGAAMHALEALDELESSARGDAPFNHFAAPLIRQYIEATIATRNMESKAGVPAQAGAESYPPSDALLAAHTDLLTYVLQGDVHNRLTPRVIDIAYTAFMQAKRPNAEDGGPSDWFNGTKPMIESAIDKLRSDLMEDRTAALRARGAVPSGLKVADVGFRWDGERQEHVPTLLVEFEAVTANSPCDAKGWRDRDAVAAMLVAHAEPTSDDGYAQAFYELAGLMGITARPLSPATVWLQEMLPRLQSAFSAHAAPMSVQPAPVVFVSPKQLEALTDLPGEHGTYLPTRRTSAGMFTMPLYAAAPAALPGDKP